MTPRKELFIKIKQVLDAIPQLEYIDLHRNQFDDQSFPDSMVSALIKINKIDWQNMPEQSQEGNTTIDIVLYCRDGWMDQHNGTTDAGHGLNEIDLLDTIAAKLQSLKGDYFGALHHMDDETEQQDMKGIFVYRQSFSCNLYRKLAPKYQPKTITIL